MGLQFKDLVVKKEIAIKDLKGKVLAVDSYNMLYQFLTTIRSPDGTVLTDSKGRVTSHLIGLFSRTTALMEQGLKLVFVFDGKPPKIKLKTWEKRTAIKQQAAKQFKEAKKAGEIEEMRKFAARTAKLDKDMVADAKNVIKSLGLPIVEAPSEGEAQTAYMVKKGDAYASISQDYDNLIFDCPTLVRNLSIAGKRRKAGKLGYKTVKPEMILLKDVLKKLDLNRKQLIALAILVGTDYNPGGIKGIGPKTALKLVKKYKNLDKLFKEAKWSEHYDISWKEIYDTITKMPVTDKYKLEWKQIDEKKLRKLLIDEHDFSEVRVNSALDKLNKVQDSLKQKGLSSFF